MNCIRIGSIALFSVALLAACGKDEDKAAVDPAAVSVESVAQEGTAVATDAVSVVVSRIVESSNGQVRYDRERDEKTGKEQRQIFIEMTGGTAEDFADKVAGYLQGTGYAVGPVRVDEDGVRMTFVHEQLKPIRLLARNAGKGPALKVAGATYSVYVTQDP